MATIAGSKLKIAWRCMLKQSIVNTEERLRQQDLGFIGKKMVTLVEGN